MGGAAGIPFEFRGKELGSVSPASSPEQDIIDTIQANKGGYGTREELLNALVPLFPEYNLDEIGYYVYTEIPG